MRILVTGASGFVGKAVARVLSDRHEVTAAVHAQSAAAARAVPLDLTQEASVKDGVARARPELVVHCAAVAAPDACERQPELARAVNARGTALLARAAEDAGARFFHISTDLVFDGAAPPYREEAPTCPLSLYGRTKVEAEAAALAHPRGLVLRIALVYGWNPGGRPTFTDELLAALTAGRRSRLFVDQYRTPTFVEDAAEAVARLAETRSEGAAARGILHLCGAERLSRLEFGRLFCETFGFDAGLLEPVRMADLPTPAPRPADCSLDGSRLRALLDWRPRPAREALALMRAASPMGYNRAS